MPSVSNRSKTMNSIQRSHHASLTTYFQMITERSIKLLSSVMLISANRIKVLRLWLTCFEDRPIRILTFAWWMLKTRKTMVSWQAFPSLPPRAPLAFPSRPKPPFLSLSNACHAGYPMVCLYGLRRQYGRCSGLPNKRGGTWRIAFMLPDFFSY